jgi:hypothetical protein
MRRFFKNLAGFLAAVAAIGAMAVLWLVLTQVVAIAIAVVVALVVALAVDWVTGVIAGIIAYAVVMKIFHYLEIFDMISSGKRRRPKEMANRANRCPPVSPDPK